MATREITCPDCSTTFTVTRGSRSQGGRWPVYCESCKVLRTREANREKQYRWREANPEKWQANQRRSNAKRQASPEHRARRREADLARVYNLTPAEHDAILDSQNGVCAICRRTPSGSTRLHVDHCHAHGHVRGLLCSNCNTLLGLAGDDPAVLQRAIEYLRRSPS